MMMSLAYQSEAAGLQVWEDTEDPRHIELSHGQQRVVQLELPKLLLSEKAMHFLHEAARQILTDLVNEERGQQFGDFTATIEQAEGGTTLAGGTLIASTYYWPYIEGSRPDVVALAPGGIVESSGYKITGGIAADDRGFVEGYFDAKRPSPRVLRDEPQA